MFLLLFPLLTQKQSMTKTISLGKLLFLHKNNSVFAPVSDVLGDYFITVYTH